jgi:hypothetical protein
MGDTKRGLALATYYNEDGERVEWLLRGLTEGQLVAVRAFLDAEYPQGTVKVGYVATESIRDFDQGFGGEFEAFVDAHRRPSLQVGGQSIATRVIPRVRGPRTRSSS